LNSSAYGDRHDGTHPEALHARHATIATGPREQRLLTVERQIHIALMLSVAIRKSRRADLVFRRRGRVVLHRRWAHGNRNANANGNRNGEP